MGITISWDITPFSTDDPVFNGFKSPDIMATADLNRQIALLNQSPVMVALLHAYKNGGVLVYNNDGPTNEYQGDTILIHDVGSLESPNDFVRVLSHELGHFFDEHYGDQYDSVRESLGGTRFAGIIESEWEESKTTAISYIIRNQILSATRSEDNPNGTDIKIGNQLGNRDPNINAWLLPDAEFGGMDYTPIADSDTLWASAAPITDWIWGKNLPLLNPNNPPTRWQKQLDQRFGAEIPDFLNSAQRTFKSADRDDATGQYMFTFTENDGGERTWVYGATEGGEGADLLVGRESGGADSLLGGGGEDVLYGGWASTDTDADTLMGGEGADTYYAGGNDTINDSGHDGVLDCNRIRLTTPPASPIADKQRHGGVGDERFADDRQWRQAA